METPSKTAKLRIDDGVHGPTTGGSSTGCIPDCPPTQSVSSDGPLRKVRKLEFDDGVHGRLALCDEKGPSARSRRRKRKRCPTPDAVEPSPAQPSADPDDDHLLFDNPLEKCVLCKTTFSLNDGRHFCKPKRGGIACSFCSHRFDTGLDLFLHRQFAHPEELAAMIADEAARRDEAVKRLVPSLDSGLEFVEEVSGCYDAEDVGLSDDDDNVDDGDFLSGSDFGDGL